MIARDTHRGVGLVVFAFVCVVLFGDASKALAWTSVMSVCDSSIPNCTPQPQKWRRPCLTYAIDYRASTSLSYAEAETIIDTSFETWTNQTCDGETTDFILQPLQPSTCQQTEFNSSAGNVNTVAFISNWQSPDGDPYDPGAFAITSNWHVPTTGEILDVDILINENLGPYGDCASTACTNRANSRADLQSIVTHEAGHFFGIGHSTVTQATMYPSQPRNATSARTLAADDIEALCTIYPPGSISGSCDFAPLNGLDLNCEDSSPLTTETCVTREADGSCGDLGSSPLPNGNTSTKKGRCSIAIGEQPSLGSTIFLWIALGITIVRRRRKG
ncbi:MAG: matrixin family metalloprotease [Polyangiales bacterium]